MEKTIKYLENGEYHYATVRSVGDLAQLKTDSKETLVEAINELWNGGGNADPSKAPKPEGYDQLVQDVADAVKNQQEISQQWIEWQNEEAQLTEERKQAYLQAMKEMQEAIDKAKADAAALDDKTAKLDEQITKTFSDLDTSIQNMHEQLQKEADRMNQDLINTKSDLTKVRTDLQNAQMDNGKIHDELTNINGKFEHKVWQTDLDPLKEQIDRAETGVQQTKDELLGKASRQDLDTVTNTVSKLDTQLKETAKGVEISVKKDELGGEIAEALTNKTNILLGTRRFTGNWWKQGEHVKFLDDPWKGFVVAEQTGDGSDTHTGITQAIDVKAGNTYVFSAYVWTKGDFGQFVPMLKLSEGDVSELSGKLDNIWLELFDVTEEPKRFSMTFTTYEDCTVYPHVSTYYFQEDSAIYSCGYQLEIGKEPTPWEPNQQDVGEYVEKTEAKFNVYNDKIQALTEKQRQQGNTQEKLRTEVTQTAEGTRQVSENLKKTNDDITKLRGEFEVRADHMKSEYETYTNKAVGQISDSTLNLIRNSSFQNKDEDFAQWQNVSAKANIRSDENGLRWVELTQSGMTTDNIIGLTSNYFNIKQGKVTVAVDIKSGIKAGLDIESVLTLELYDENKKRVDFTRLTLNDLGLNKTLLEDHQVHRGLYRLGIDRNDAKYMTVKALLARNGDLYFTNFSARLSSIDDGAYEPNPDDINQQILKQNTKIEQNSKEVAIKANSVDVTRDIKSAVDNVQVGGTNLANKTNQGTINWMCDPGNGTTNLTEVNINGARGVRFNNTRKTTSWWVAKYALDLNKFEPNTDYVISFDIRTPMNVELYGSMFDIAGGDSLNGYFTDTSIHGVIPANKLTHISVSKHTKDNFDKDHYQSFYLNSWNLSRCDWVDFVNFKIEKGNKGTNYSAAPEDVSEEIKTAKDAAIKVASDQINIHVNEISTQFDDKLNKRINEQKTASEKFTSDGIEQTVTKITNVKNDVDRLGDKVNGIQVGGRNLVTGTEQDIVIDDTSNTQDKGWCLVIIHLTQQPKLGDQITVSAEATLTGRGDLSSYSAVLFNSTTTNGRSALANLIPGKRSNATLTINNLDGTGDTVLLLYAGKQSDTQGKKNIIHHLKVEFGNQATDWTPAPEDIDKKIDTQTLDSANIDDLRIQGHYFVRNLTGNPIGGWVYVDVTGNNNDRIRQDVYQDNGSKHMYRRGFNGAWSGWEQGAYLSDVNNVKTEVTASVKNLGDRVTTEVNSITTRQNNFENETKAQHSNDVELVRKSDFEDGSKGSWTVHAVVPATNPTPPAELGQSGMKVLQTNTRDGYEDGIWYSVKPGEKFDVDYWCAPSPAFHTTFGLLFVDKNKNNYNWQGISSDQSGQWKHYTGTITAPANASFAKPWYQMDKPANNTTNSSWIAKPHIRRQNPQVAEKISELNTKWDVANGQIQGKVTATDVNNILNGKGYATQSWAQTMFQMKSDSITLQAVRDNITNGIQNQVNNIQGKLEGDLSNICRNPTFSHGVEGWKSSHLAVEGPWSEMPTPKNGTLFVRDAYYGELFPVSKGERYYTSVFAHNGDSADFVLGLCFKLKDGNLSWIGGSRVPGGQTGKYDGYIDVPDNAVSAQIWASIQKFDNFGWVRFTNVVVKKNDAISQINLSPDQIKIASNKIVIDGNTDIHGTLRVPDVKLAGRNGNVDLSGDGINITKTNGAGINIASNGIQLTANTNGQNEIEGVITTAWNMNNKNQNGIGLILTTEQELGRPYGGDILAIGSMPSLGKIHAGMVFDATGITPEYKKGFNWFAPHTLNGDGGVLRFPGAQDDLMLYPGNMPGSRQSSYSQPTLRLVHGNSQGSAGIQFQWNDIVPFGRIETTHSYFAPVGANNDSGLGIGWVHWSNWDWDGNVPMIHRRDPNGGVNSGFAFFSSGDIVLWKGEYRSNLAWKIPASDPAEVPRIGGF